MIDKIKLYTGDFEVERSNNLKVKQGEIRLNDGEVEGERVLFYIKGEPIFGKKAYLNNDDIHYSIDIDSKGLFITLNPSIVFYREHNLYPVNEYQLRDVMRMIKEDIRKQGIKVNVDDMDISRLDLCKDVKLLYPFSVYGNVFSWLDGKRMDRLTYGSSYVFRNKSREIIFYDKLSELEKVYRVPRGRGGFTPRDTLMRGEVRLRKKKVVLRDLEISRAGELYKRETFEWLKEKYKDILRDVVFTSGDIEEDDDYSFKTEEEKLRYFNERYGRNSLYRYLSMEGLGNILMRVGGLRNFEELLKRVYGRSYVSKQMRRIKEDLKMIKGIEERGKGGFKELYIELYDKFLKVA